jgi:hypothetical protein
MPTVARWITMLFVARGGLFGPRNVWDVEQTILAGSVLDSSQRSRHGLDRIALATNARQSRRIHRCGFSGGQHSAKPPFLMRDEVAGSHLGFPPLLSLRLGDQERIALCQVQMDGTRWARGGVGPDALFGFALRPVG